MKHCPNADCDHLARHGRVAEFLDTVEVCSDCGAALRHGEAPLRPPPEYRELETVYETTSQIQAHLVRSLLEERGIAVHVSGEALQGALGELPPTMLSVRVQVPVADAAAARECVEAYERGTRGPPDAPED